MKYENNFDSFSVKWIYANRTNPIGRGSGGIAIGINEEKMGRNLKAVVKLINGIEIIEIRFPTRICNLAPLYIRGADWLNEFSQIKTLMETTIENPILIGDVNVRIGSLQQVVHILELRPSKDDTINTFGRTYMNFLEENNLLLLNGRSNDDIEGEFTYISTCGVSVNDLCAISYGMLDMYSSFKVPTKSWSDHMPLVLELKYEVPNTNFKSDTHICPILKYASKIRYAQAVSSKITDLEIANENINLESLVTVIRNSCDQRKGFIRFKQPWYNFNCHNAKRKMDKCMKALRKCSQYELENKKRYYLDARQLYRKICDESRERFQSTLFYKINTITSTSEWWNCINRLKSRNLTKKGCIELNDFKNYFYNLLNPPLSSSAIQYAEPLINDLILDCEINMEEVLFAIKNVKLKKSPGEDRVTYECLKDAPSNFLECFLKFYNQVYMGEQEISKNFKNS